MIITDMGVPVGHLVQSVTKITLVNNTQLITDLTVPAGKRWRLLNIIAHNPDDVDRGIDMWKYVEAAKTNLIKRYQFRTVGASEYINWPGMGDTYEWPPHGNVPEILDEGNTISIVHYAGGASTGGSRNDGLVIEYLEIDI